MADINDSLAEGERIETLFELHWYARVPVILWIFVGFLTLGFAWLLALYEGQRLKHLNQGLTDRRALRVGGLRETQTEEMMLDSIESVRVEQGVLARGLDVGNVRMTGAGAKDLVFEKVADPWCAKGRIEAACARAVGLGDGVAPDHAQPGTHGERSNRRPLVES